MKIFIVTTGSYSDYTIQGVFSTIEKAQEFIYLREWDGDIEEYEIDDPRLLDKTGRESEEIGPIYTAWIVKKDGFIQVSNNVETGYRHPSQCFYYETAGSIRVTSPISKEHVQKVAVEKYQEYLRGQ